MKRKLALILAIATCCLTACSQTCKIDGCSNEIYKDGLCKTHYYAAEGANMLNDILGGGK